MSTASEPLGAPAPTILVVDDSKVVRTFHGYILRTAGYRVVEAENGFLALEALHGQRIDLAVVDVNMPHMDGFTFLRHVRATDGLAELPVIIVSTEAEQEDQLQATEAGANAYVVKPAQPAALVEGVDELLRTRG